ncbi:MAG: tetratricopeptide repeat protein [Paludibacteraceae bacterium]|nr:tetratricopeptide repeat protein [Paludibacteraceae bacterium]
MKKIIIAILALFPLVAMGQNDWENANTAYANGEYENAIIGYENILQQTPSAEVYYNLGNAYFRTGEIARAILSYERSLRLAPGNKDAQNNLAFAQTRIIDDIKDNSQFFVKQWAQSLRNSQSESAWLTTATILFCLASLTIMLFLFLHNPLQRRLSFYTAILSLILCVNAIWCGLSLHHRDTARNEAIIIQGIVNAKAAPDKSGTDLFVLHEGTKVNISDMVGEWCEIKVGNNVGWIKLNALERI